MRGRRREGSGRLVNKTVGQYYFLCVFFSFHFFYLLQCLFSLQQLTTIARQQQDKQSCTASWCFFQKHRCTMVAMLVSFCVCSSAHAFTLSQSNPPLKIHISSMFQSQCSSQVSIDKPLSSVLRLLNVGCPPAKLLFRGSLSGIMVQIHFEQATEESQRCAFE